MMESVQAGQVDALVRLVTQHAVAGRLSHADRHGAMLCLARIKWYDRAFMQVRCARIRLRCSRRMTLWLEHQHLGARWERGRCVMLVLHLWAGTTVVVVQRLRGWLQYRAWCLHANDANSQHMHMPLVPPQHVVPYTLEKLKPPKGSKSNSSAERSSSNGSSSGAASGEEGSASGRESGSDSDQWEVSVDDSDVPAASTSSSTATAATPTISRRALQTRDITLALYLVAMLGHGFGDQPEGAAEKAGKATPGGGGGGGGAGDRLADEAACAALFDAASAALSGRLASMKDSNLARVAWAYAVAGQAGRPGFMQVRASAVVDGEGMYGT